MKECLSFYAKVTSLLTGSKILRGQICVSRVLSSVKPNLAGKFMIIW